MLAGHAHGQARRFLPRAALAAKLTQFGGSPAAQNALLGRHIGISAGGFSSVSEGAGLALIALGSNQGDRHALFLNALKAIGELPKSHGVVET